VIPALCRNCEADPGRTSQVIWPMAT
jgi:hypothetical protein